MEASDAVGTKGTKPSPNVSCSASSCTHRAHRTHTSASLVHPVVRLKTLGVCSLQRKSVRRKCVCVHADVSEAGIQNRRVGVPHTLAALALHPPRAMPPSMWHWRRPAPPSQAHPPRLRRSHLRSISSASHLVATTVCPSSQLRPSHLRTARTSSPSHRPHSLRPSPTTVTLRSPLLHSPVLPRARAQQQPPAPAPR
jgi:hypothetical protein